MASQAGPSPEARQAQFEQAVAISLHLWLSLTVAVQNHWGGPSSADKRDWFAGAIVDMFPSLVDVAKAQAQSTAAKAQSSTTPAPTTKSQSNTTPRKIPDDPPQEDVEAVLLQVMLDEFETNVDDESEVDVAARIVHARARCAAGDFSFVEDLRRRWLDTKGKKVVVEAKEQNQEAEWDDVDSDDDDDDDEEEGDSDVEMGEAPALVPVVKEKPPPEVDEDGFTKVTKKKR
ncbi:Uu.00g128380.m01.CDS01 [Anthostomella pinea]|uniref:Uu.00g128380.m01.CDS01 n=1 Tax=Anthostomella pinea TaxID=933095 RepID=A0AAI8YHZ1_9PEZI|nr:Uu.00g128380.m01.CDS01 [Anthostomella pinea]